MQATDQLTLDLAGWGLRQDGRGVQLPAERMYWEELAETCRGEKRGTPRGVIESKVWGLRVWAVAFT